MLNKIPIDDKADYNVSEFGHILKRAISAIQNEMPDGVFFMPGDQAFFLVKDMLEWINRQVPGEFRIRQIKSREYTITYFHEKERREKYRKRNDKARIATADRLEQMTGRRPSWGQREVENGS